MKSTIALGAIAALAVTAWVFLWAPWDSEPRLHELAGGLIAEELYLPSTIAHGPVDDEEDVALERESALRLPVRVETATGWQVPGARIGFSFSKPKLAGPPERQARSNHEGLAIFEFAESDFAGRELDMCTVALLVPSNPPQVQEVRADRLALTPVHFTRPITGQLSVIVARADGLPIADGTLVYLQLAGNKFKPKLGKCVSTAKLVNGEALFDYVGVNTTLTVAVKNDEVEGGYSTLDFRGPSAENEQLHVELVLPGPIPTIQLHATGEGGVAAMNEQLSGRVAYLLARNQLREFDFSAALDKEGVAKVQFPRDLIQASEALLATEVRSQSAPDTAELRLGLRTLYHRTLEGQFQKWVVHHGNDLMVSGQVIDQFGDPFSHCALRFTVMMDSDSNTTPRLSWDFNTDGLGHFQIYAPNLPGLDYGLNAVVARYGRFSFEFVPGDKDKEFVAIADPQFLGHILVDDPKYISQLSFGNPLNLEELDQQDVTWRKIEDDGTFRFRARFSRKTRPDLHFKTTGEQLDARSYMNANPRREGHFFRYPDWDLRGKIFPHQLNVKNEDGGSVGEVTYRFPGIDGGRQIVAKEQLEFLSGHAQVPLFVNAEGYREQKVMSKGKADVLLRKGIPLQVSFDPPLPVQYGVQWRILLKERSSALEFEQLNWQKVYGRVAHLSLPTNGTWDVYLRAAPSSVDSNYGWPDTNLDGVLDEAGKAIKVYNEDLEITLSFSTKEYAQAIELMRESQLDVALRLPRD